VREADTAERLDLVVLDECPRSDIDTVLPAKVEATFTVDNVVSRYRQERSRRKYNKVISATAAPFVPSLKARVTALPSPQTIGEVLEVAHDKPSGIRTDKEVVPIRDTVAIVEQDRLSYSEHRKESHQKDCLLIGEMVSREVTQILEPESDASENSDGFYAPELPVSTPTTTVNNEETNHEGSYDDLLTFWALDDDANEPNPRNTGYWGISSFLGRFGSRQG
jgi:hypothetical protein